jgi:minor curlin subunit
MRKFPQLTLAVFMPLLFICSFVSYGQDLLNGTDLQDSPLSLSLTTSMLITVNNQTQQLVINQYGIFNKVTVSQMADAENSIDISQNGINNMADIAQSGYGNTVNVNQQGNNNLAEIDQIGDANIANVWQEGEQTFVVRQIGNEMVVNVTQY